MLASQENREPSGQPLKQMITMLASQKKNSEQSGRRTASEHNARITRKQIAKRAAVEEDNHNASITRKQTAKRAEHNASITRLQRAKRAAVEDDYHSASITRKQRA